MTLNNKLKILFRNFLYPFKKAEIKYSIDALNKINNELETKLESFSYSRLVWKEMKYDLEKLLIVNEAKYLTLITEESHIPEKFFYNYIYNTTKKKIEDFELYTGIDVILHHHRKEGYEDLMKCAEKYLRNFNCKKIDYFFKPENILIKRDTYKIYEWCVKEGEYINKGDLLIVVETELATEEVESEFAGKIERFYFNVGESFNIKDPIALFRIEQSEQDIS